MHSGQRVERVLDFYLPYSELRTSTFTRKMATGSGLTLSNRYRVPVSRVSAKVVPMSS